MPIGPREPPRARGRHSFAAGERRARPRVGRCRYCPDSKGKHGRRNQQETRPPNSATARPILRKAPSMPVLASGIGNLGCHDRQRNDRSCTSCKAHLGRAVNLSLYSGRACFHRGVVALGPPCRPGRTCGRCPKVATGRSLDRRQRSQRPLPRGRRLPVGAAMAANGGGDGHHRTDAPCGNPPRLGPRRRAPGNPVRCRRPGGRWRRGLAGPARLIHGTVLQGSNAGAGADAPRRR